MRTSLWKITNKPDKKEKVVLNQDLIVDTAFDAFGTSVNTLNMDMQQRPAPGATVKNPY